MGPSTTSRPLALMFLISSRNGHPCWTFQITFGRKMSAASAPPSQIHGCVKVLRAGLKSTPTTNAPPKITIEYLFLEPEPSHSPEAEPETLVACLDDAHDNVCTACPEQRLVGVHREEVGITNVIAREGACQRREGHGEAAAAELARKEAVSRTRAIPAKRRGRAHGEQRRPERVLHEPGHDGRSGAADST